MKATAKQLAEQYVRDNKYNIQGNVAEHLINNARNAENGYYEYLTDEEITEYEGASQDRRRSIQVEIEQLLTRHFNYTFSYNVHFNDSESSNDKGFEQTLDYCKHYIDTYNGTNESYFADYKKDGFVSIVCNETGETVYVTDVL